MLVELLPTVVRLEVLLLPEKPGPVIILIRQEATLVLLPGKITFVLVLPFPLLNRSRLLQKLPTH